MTVGAEKFFDLPMDEPRDNVLISADFRTLCTPRVRIRTTRISWRLSSRNTSPVRRRYSNRKPCNSEKHLVYACDDEGGCDGRRRQSHVSLRAIAIAAARRCRRTGLVLCRRFELMPPRGPYAAALFKFRKWAPRDGTEITKKTPGICGVSDFGSLPIPPRTPLPKDGCYRTLSDDI
jgi:hypothetical protein